MSVAPKRQDSQVTRIGAWLMPSEAELEIKRLLGLKGKYGKEAEDDMVRTLNGLFKQIYADSLNDLLINMSNPLSDIFKIESRD